MQRSRFRPPTSRTSPRRSARSCPSWDARSAESDRVKVEPAVAVVGHVALPGDKSISHRAVLLGGLGEGETHVQGFGRSADTMATVQAMRALGVEVEELGDEELRVHGVGLRGLRAPDAPVDCANAGTLLRLLTGIVAGQRGHFELTGDESLRSRPIERIAEPLRRMGATIATEDGHAPVVVEGSDALKGIDYELPVASAQVKSAVLLAGLNAERETTVVEPKPTRDHTELMLEAGGVRVRRRPGSVTVSSTGSLRLGELVVPGDFSSAAPLFVAVALVPGSEVTVHELGLNARRIGLLDDELPLVALLGSHARGETVVRGAAELRVKESDRIEAVTDGLRACGARVHSTEDGWRIVGVPRRLKGGRVEARGDHRIAMLGAIAGLASKEGVEIDGAETVAVSFPGFFDLLDSVV